mgnify:CR=1 FL=1
MENIKNFIFDFGGVLYKIDHTNTIKMLEKLIKRSNSHKIIIPEVFLNHQKLIEYEKGLLSNTEFINFIRNEFELVANDEEIISAINSTIVDIYPDSIVIVKEFKKIGNLFLLSNTCKLHYDFFFPKCKELFNLFNKCYFSLLTGLRKPEPQAFMSIVDETGIEPTETVFIDDSLVNIEAAKALNFKVIHLKSQNNLSDLLHTVKSNTQFFG